MTETKPDYSAIVPGQPAERAVESGALMDAVLALAAAEVTRCQLDAEYSEILGVLIGSLAVTDWLARSHVNQEQRHTCREAFERALREYVRGKVQGMED